MNGRTQWIVFGLALALLVALSGWWTVLIHRSIGAERDVSMRVLELQIELADADPAVQAVDREAQLEAIDDRYERRIVMVMGEGGLLFVLVGICFFMLLRLVRQEQRQIRAMQRFIGSVTHEMKTPLAGIRNLLQTAAADKLPEDRAEELMRMGLSESERLEHMIENVLIAGRLRSDRQPLRMNVTALREFLESFVAHRRESLVQTEQVIVAGDIPEIDVLVDPDGLRVILENLVDNGVKYGGKEPRVRIGVREEADRVVIEVGDEGEGFEPAEAETLFEPFHRAISPRSNSHGTGLGLSIARALTRRMGGDLVAHSDGPNRGSRFDVQLPGRPR